MTLANIALRKNAFLLSILFLPHPPVKMPTLVRFPLVSSAICPEKEE